MAYNDKYILPFYSSLGIKGNIRLKKNDYVGATTQLKLAADGLSIDYKFGNWFDPIVGQNCSLAIINDASNFYAYEDLFTLNEREFKIVIDASDALGRSIELFNGFINSNTVQTDYLRNSKFNLAASNYVDKLGKTKTPLVYNVGTKNSFINVLQDSLRQTGKDASIWVLNSLEPCTNMGSNQTLFNYTGCDLEVFWKNESEQLSSLDIIKKILVPFDSYIYWWDKAWRIIRYGDAWRTNGQYPYKIYSGSNSYSYISTADVSIQYEPSANIDSYIITDKSQRISFIPGIKTLDLELNQKEYISLSFLDIGIATGQNYDWSSAYPPIRGWWYYQSSTFPGPPVVMFDTSIGFGMPGNWTLGGGKIGTPYKQISSAIMRWGVPQTAGQNDKDKAFIATRFMVTLDDATSSSVLDPTTLNIKWKYAPAKEWAGIGKTPQDYDYRIRYVLRVPPGNNFIHYNADNDVWEYVTSSVKDDVINYVEISGDNLDPDTFVGEISITIPIGETLNLPSTGDTQLVFTLLGEDTRETGASTWNGYTAAWYQAYYGDFRISGTAQIQDNVIRSEFTENSLSIEKEEVAIELFDTKNLLYKNGIFTLADYTKRTEWWTDEAETQFMPLAQWLIKDKLALFNKNRRIINADIRYGGFIKPFSAWYDGFDPQKRKYILTNYTYKPQTDNYTCEFTEWSNDEINFL